MNQSKEWKLELKALRAELKAAELDLAEMRMTCADEQGKVRKQAQKDRRDLERRVAGYYRNIHRELTRYESGARKIVAKLTRRIGILEGRLS